MDVPEEIISFMDEVIEINRDEIEYKHIQEMQAQKVELREEMEQQLEAQNVEMRKEMDERFKCLTGKEIKRDLSATSAESCEDSPEPQDSNRFLATLKRAIGTERYSGMTNLNTETLTMFAVTEILKKDGKIVRKTIISMLSLLLILLQVFVLDLVIAESGGPDCSSMADCPLGMHCGFPRFDHPTCRDCQNVIELKTLENMTTNEKRDEFCQKLYPDIMWTELNIADIDHHVFRLGEDTNVKLRECLSFKHCQNTDIDVDNDFKGRCDFLDLNYKCMNKRIWVVIVFLGLLWALPITQDIEEACVEETVLDYHLRGSLFIPAEIVRLALRLRRCALPFFATSATLTLLITDQFSAKNDILNFLAITFISEADNMLAALFLRTGHIEQMNKVVEDIDIDTVPYASTAFFWARVQGIYCFLVLVFGLRIADSRVDSCDEVNGFGFELAEYAAYVLLGALFFYKACVKRDEETRFMQIFCALNEGFRNFLVWLLGYFVIDLVSSAFGKDKYAFQQSTFQLVVIFPFIVLESCRWIWYKRSQKMGQRGQI